MGAPSLAVNTVVSNAAATVTTTPFNLMGHSQTIIQCVGGVGANWSVAVQVTMLQNPDLATNDDWVTLETIAVNAEGSFKSAAIVGWRQARLVCTRTAGNLDAYAGHFRAG